VTPPGARTAPREEDAGGTRRPPGTKGAREGEPPGKESPPGEAEETARQDDSLFTQPPCLGPSSSTVVADRAPRVAAGTRGHFVSRRTQEPGSSPSAPGKGPPTPPRHRQRGGRPPPPPGCRTGASPKPSGEAAPFQPAPPFGTPLRAVQRGSPTPEERSLRTQALARRAAPACALPGICSTRRA